MGPIKRLEMAFQAYQFALDAVRLTERQNHPELSAEELNWRIVGRRQGQQFMQRTLIPSLRAMESVCAPSSSAPQVTSTTANLRSSKRSQARIPIG